MINEIIDKMNEKLGDNKDLILDNIAELYNYDNSTQETIKAKDNEINTLKSRNETLTSVNANLLKSVPLSTEKEIEEPVSEPTETRHSFKSCFDEKGNFKS